MFARRKKIKTFYVIMLGAVFLFAVHRLLFPCFSFVNAASSVLMYPVLVVQRSVVMPIKSFFKRKKNRNKLEQQLCEVQKAYQTVMAENIKVRASLVYYKEVKELVDFNRRYEGERALIAQILLRQMDQGVQMFFVDKGARHGVQGDMVAVYQNCLVGRVTDVYPLYSKVTLVTDTTCKVAAHCLQTGTLGIHVGTNKSYVTRLQRVSHLSSVKEGDLVVSSGEGLVFPQGFSLGRIKTAMHNGLYFDVAIEPLIDLCTINYCSVMKKGECDVL